VALQTVTSMVINSKKAMPTFLMFRSATSRNKLCLASL